MQRFLRGAAAMAAVATLVMAVAGCNTKGGGAPGGGGTGGSGGSTDLNMSDAVATINGDTITRAQFYKAMEAYIPNMQSPMGQQPAGRAALEQLLNVKLIVGLAKQEGVTPTDDQVTASFSDFKWRQEGQAVKPVESALEDAGYTVDSFKANQVLPSLCMQNLVAKGITVTDAEIKAYYEVNKAKMFTRPERAHIKRIVLSTKADADQIVSGIKSGKQFEEFASRSMVSTPPDGDLTQWVPLDSSGGTAIKPLVDAITKTNAGDTVDSPIAFQGTFWVIKVVEKKPKEEATLDTVHNIIQTTLLNQKTQQNPAAMSDFRAKLSDYTMKADVKITDAQYKDIADQMKHPPAPPPTMAPPPSGPAGKPGPGGKPTIQIVPSKPGAPAPTKP
jgi:parvulin-like peptidyl-prolyl isomerase